MIADQLLMKAKATITEREGRERKRVITPAAPHLIRVLDYEHPLVPGSRHSLAGVTEVELGRGEATTIERAGARLRLSVDDPRMSQRHTRITVERGVWTVEDLRSRNGTYVDGARLERGLIEDGMLVELGRTAFLFRMLPPTAPPDLAARDLPSPLPGLTTFSPRFATALDDLARIATTKLAVLVHGETGCGKEVVARGIHAASRRDGPFVAVNCGALPEHLIESELFGYRKGAFSGASEDRAGLVRSAHGGTLFLDEIADLPLSTQAVLLRVLQEGEVLPLGGTRPIVVDVRVVAATHADLEQHVTEGRFREDLLARLGGFVIAIPSVRARREDLGILMASLLRRFGVASSVRLSPSAGHSLLSYQWPRNVRELEQVLGAAAALAVGGQIELDDLGPAADPVDAARSAGDVDDLSPSEVRRKNELRALLATYRGNITAVARKMGVGRMQIHRWLHRYAIDVSSFRGTRGS